MKNKNLYAMFYVPGAFLAETFMEKVDSEDPKDIKVPYKSVIMFKIIERVEGKSEFSDGTSKKVYKDKVLKSYFIGEFLSIDDVAKIYGKDSIIYGNVVRNKWKGVYRTPFGYCKEAEKDDGIIVLSEKDVNYEENENE